MIGSRRRLWFAIFCCSVGLALIFHAALLQLVAYPLIRSDQPSEQATHLLLLRSAKTSPAAFDYAKTFAATSPKNRVLVLRDFIRRSEAMGATASFVDETVAMLVESGVPRQQIEVIGDGHVMVMSEQLRYTANWLHTQPNALQLQIATKRFECGYVTSIANDVVEKQLRPRIHILGFMRGGVDQTNWWKSSKGVKWFLRAYLRLVHLHVFGNSRPEINWDPDDFERTLQQGARNAAAA